MIKMMLNKQFGKEFMKGVTSITIVDYSDASEDVCKALRADIDASLSVLEEIDLDGMETDPSNRYLRSFASSVDEKAISDFIIVIEDNDTKTLMYMAGKIDIESLKK